MATVAVMTTTMTMNRLIHDAVRRDLDRLTSALGSVADGDSDRARDLDRAFANLRNELTHHHEGEDRWIWPMLANAGIDADLLAAMESEHQAMSEALAETSSAAAWLRSDRFGLRCRGRSRECGRLPDSGGTAPHP